SAVHELEAGGLAIWIRRAVLIGAAVAIFLMLLLTRFHGLTSGKGMEQAQIARELARGNGFATKMIRPLSIWSLRQHGRSVETGTLVDTYHAPLNPLLNSIFLNLTRGSWAMTTDQLVYPSDRMIAGISMLLLLAAIAINYLTAKRLFDRRLALIGAGLLLVCGTFWQFAQTGLPQMLMLFLFSGCTYMLVRAIEVGAGNRLFWAWIAGCAALFGLLALTHALTIWIFFGALIFVALFFRPRGLAAGVMLAIFLVIYSPWLVRTYHVSGTPFGIAMQSILYQIGGTESLVMRAMSKVAQFSIIGLRSKILTQSLDQFGRFFSLLGYSVAAPVFFISLLHLFRKPETGAFRWCVLLMWLFALLGMSVFGLEEKDMSANDLHLLFIPLLTFYGLAFLLVQWSRLEIGARALHLGFLSLIFTVTAVPLAMQILGVNSRRVEWPPYLPPYIALMGSWFREDEIIVSDMPWAVAWYGDRRSLWLPNEAKDLVNLHDYNGLGAPINGMYLTPISGNQPFISTLVKGEYKDWANLIMRAPLAADFPFQRSVALPMENECILYADHVRWPEK
ncbi:MAG: glycosyltransferase family 39 protein, partial [Verrucomicrobiota bacterium]|nr:glycosyltransferase family 39 protein [Verrucomicrobiota bacterium]